MSMCPTMESLTFDDLSQIQREENKSKALTRVRPDLYRAMADLLTNLHSEYMKLMSKDPDSVMCEGARMHSKKADTLCKMIVSTRAQKICNKAVISAEGGTVELDCLTHEERELYMSVVESSKRYLSTVDRLRGKTIEMHIDDPIVRPVKTEEPVEPVAVVTETPKAAEPAVVPKEEPSLEEIPAEFAEEDIQLEESFDDIPEPEEIPVDLMPDEPPQIVETVEKPDIDMVLLRITEDLPPFVGPDRDYELSKEDIVTLPAPMAAALINSQKAVKVNPSL